MRDELIPLPFVRERRTQGERAQQLQVNGRSKASIQATKGAQRRSRQPPMQPGRRAWVPSRTWLELVWRNLR